MAKVKPTIEPIIKRHFPQFFSSTGMCVGATELGKIMGMSRQNVHNVLKKERKIRYAAAKALIKGSDKMLNIEELEPFID